MIYDANGNPLGATDDVNIEKWDGKKIIVDGSSITSGGSGRPVDPTWPHYIEDYLNVTIYDHSKSGSQWVYYYGGDRTTSYMRIQDYEQDADCIITMGDFSTSRGLLGTIEDTADIDATTYYARLKAYAEALIAAFPLIPIIWAIEPPRNWNNHNDPTSANEQTAKAIKDVAELYGFPVADCLHQTIYRPYNPTNYASNTSDGTHPWNNIQKGMAQIILETMKKTPVYYVVNS